MRNSTRIELPNPRALPIAQAKSTTRKTLSPLPRKQIPHSTPSPSEASPSKASPSEASPSEASSPMGDHNAPPTKSP
ncbi:MAG: hypothetical protein DWH99_13390 [Planctomycetota bacterium]|nr:MAG: hypothetical protein DWH99_13390 [Planctomycetota bacterium]